MTTSDNNWLGEGNDTAIYKEQLGRKMLESETAEGTPGGSYDKHQYILGRG